MVCHIYLAIFSLIKIKFGFILYVFYCQSIELSHVDKNDLFLWVLSQNPEFAENGLGEDSNINVYD